MEEFRERLAGFGAGAELRLLIAEASQALARLDKGRLEELALSCQSLNRALVLGDKEERKLLAEQAREAASDMAVFARVLDATRANLHVMNRLRELRMGRLEYTERQARGGLGAGSPSTGPCRCGEDAEAGHGDH